MPHPDVVFWSERRIVMRLVPMLCAALTLFLAGRSFGAGIPTETPGPVTLWVVSDLHYLAPGLHDAGPRFSAMLQNGDNKNTALVPVLLETLTWSASTCRPDAIVVTGDLTFNGEAESHRELAGVFRRLEAAGVPVFVLPGNHDLNNPYARSYTGTAAEVVPTVITEEFARLYAEFGWNDALSRDAESLSYCVRLCPGVQLLMIDSTDSSANLDRGYPEVGGALSDGTRRWIEACAEAAKRSGDRIVAALHHSLVDHNPLIHLGYTIDEGETVADQLARAGVSWTLTGHTHIQDIVASQTSAGTIYDITTGALSVFPHHYGVVRLTPGAGRTDLDYHTEALRVADWAQSRGISDPALRDFREAAETYLRVHTAQRMADQLEEGFSEDDPDLAARVLEVLVTLNLKFFAGREGEDTFDRLNEEDLALVQQLPDGFLADYAATILSDTFPRDNQFALP